MSGHNVHRRRIPAYSVEPKGSTSCVVVLHEVWGLVPHIEDVCKRLGKLGFASSAPDLYWRKKEALNPQSIQRAMEGVWDLTLEERRHKSKVRGEMVKKGFGQATLGVISTLYSEAFRDALVSDTMAVVRQARAKYRRTAVLGFCLGGGLALKVAARVGGLSSVVSFYGEPPGAAEVKRISSPTLAIHAARDEIINPKVPGLVEAALTTGKDLTLKIYPDTRHGFFNDTNASVYSSEAAKDAWKLATRFLGETL